jgi:hypothetical protein
MAKTELFGEFLKNKSVRQNKIYFSNNQFVQGRNSEGTADLNMFKINGNNELEFSLLPIYSGVMEDSTPNSALVTKEYVLNILAGLRDPKDAVRAASVGNLDLANMPAQIDGITLSFGDRFLAKNQTDAKENGIYLFQGAGSAAFRSADANANDEVKQGMSMLVAEGTVNAHRQYMLATVNPIELGTSELVFVRIPNPSDLVIEMEEIITLDANDLDTNGYVDLANLALEPSVKVTPIGGILQEKGEAYTMSVEGGVTRITFGTSGTVGSLGELLKQVQQAHGSVKLSVIYEKLAN